MLSDYYVPLTKRVVTRALDSGGSYTETTADSDIRGYMAYLSSSEQIRNQQNGLIVNARLFTTEILSELDRIVDADGNVFEIVGKYNFFHRYYELKKL